MTAKPGDEITAALKSTSGARLTVIAADMTAEIDLKGNTGAFMRVPCVFAADRHGAGHVLVQVPSGTGGAGTPHDGASKWLGARHRRVTMFREVEDRDGEHIAVSDPDLGKRMEAALNA